MHKNIKSVNILLDDKLAVRVSECGLAPLLSSGSTSEFSGSLFVSYGYAAPEIEFGSYTCQSDVYSLGVVMLELLTGRESFDRSRPLGEQFLVRWAIQQLHDIDALVRMVDITLNGDAFAQVKSQMTSLKDRTKHTLFPNVGTRIQTANIRNSPRPFTHDLKGEPY
ncbi:protein STRUBBELIG-RECEPTOR FAMILY 3-like [Gossypium australe]|uniref:Protein STRUBBELIG-RECEPTOR FAMILY 3-like n=1 Tax=Gossypium australe TaxID=47621 RepID=A0A5B6WAU8_9ROSI|nr:protein STRUBBELIG-RECEPTOR FAMILY 3-like [Gossypium australe]